MTTRKDRLFHYIEAPLSFVDWAFGDHAHQAFGLPKIPW